MPADHAREHDPLARLLMGPTQALTAFLPSLQPLLIQPGPTLDQSVRCVVLDLLFVALTVLFFVVSLGYIAVCDRLMK